MKNSYIEESEAGSRKEPIVLCESSDDDDDDDDRKSRSAAPSNYAAESSVRATAEVRMSVSELKRRLDERGIDYSDCLEKRELVDRLVEKGLNAGGCSVGAKRESQCDNQPRTATEKRPRPSPSTIHTQNNVIDSHIKLLRTDLDLQNSSPVIRDNCLTIRQMLGLDASVPAYYTDCSIEWMVISNFMIDFDYILGLIPELYSIPTCAVFYGQAPPSLVTASWKQATDVDFVELDPSEKPKSPKNPLKYKFPYGVHHTKMFLVGFSNGSLRVIVHTANLLQGDCQRKTQGAYIQDFPLKAANSEATEFENDLVDYIQTYGYEAQKQWDRGGVVTTLCQLLRRYDFGSAKAVLIASTPGYHSVSEKKKPLRGYLKLAKAIHDHCPASSASSQPIVCQFSSMGSLTPTWLKQFATALNAAQQPCDNLESSLKLVFPTAEEIRTSVEGYSGGGSVPSAAKNVDKGFLQPLYHKWSCRTPSILHKPHNVPHIKTFYQLAGDSRFIQWFCVTSHNLSTAAWGQVQSNKWGGQSFFVRHWELGVFVAPGMFESDVQMGPAPEAGLGRTLAGNNDDTKRVVGIPLPFPIQPTKYGDEDEVFSWEKTYARSDAFGQRSTRGF